VAHVARTSPQFVRATLKEHGLTLPESQVGRDGKTYSTTRKVARLRALRDALEKADRYLTPEARCLGQELLGGFTGVEQ